ncbi:hypothetical protein Lesp01_50790 [Lentzea sp. NBRC 102530]|nr:hypothetical protein Lesp01_50790 [Lentzea sp. NBRC 102530]
MTAGVVAAYAVVRRRRAAAVQPSDRWPVVTVSRAPEEVRASLPEDLAHLHGQVEFQVRPATGDKGTELVAKASGDVPRHELRLAPRRMKAVLEAGEVVRPDVAPTHPGPMGKALQLVTSRAGGGGRL